MHDMRAYNTCIQVMYPSWSCVRNNTCAIRLCV